MKHRAPKLIIFLLVPLGALAPTIANAEIEGWATETNSAQPLGQQRKDAENQQASLPEPPPGQHWVKIEELSDEFNGTELDVNKWSPRHPYWHGGSASHFAPENVSVNGGVLQLHSTAAKNPSEVKDRLNELWLKSACVSSTKPAALYGFYQARLKASKLSMFSSFWFQNKYAEIDVAEQIGSPGKHEGERLIMAMNTHFFTNGGVSSPNRQNQERGAKAQMSSGAADNFHVYGVWWKEPNTVVFYLDGKEVANVKPPQPFTEPMFMFFDTEVHSFYGPPAIDSLKDPNKNTMTVDWIRSWKLVAN